MKDIIIINSEDRQLKGDIHMHTTRSDGKLSPEDAIRKHQEAGYDFIMISDHELYWDNDAYDNEKFLVLGGAESSILMNKNYSWPLNHYRKELQNTRNQHTYMHYNCMKDYSIEDKGQYFSHDERVPQMTDRGIDSWNEQVDSLIERGNLVFLNHPHWSRLAPEMMLASNNVIAFEVWNSCDINGTGGRSDEEIWDYCLTRGKKFLAVATDDAHKYVNDFNAGFTMVHCKEFSKAAICRAFKNGKFYASCGPVVKDMRIENGVLKMQFSPVREINVVGYDVDGCYKRAEDGRMLDSFEWEINTNMRYFRVELTDENGRKAWMQPVFVEDLV